MTDPAELAKRLRLVAASCDDAMFMHAHTCLEAAELLDQLASTTQNPQISAAHSDKSADLGTTPNCPEIPGSSPSTMSAEDEFEVWQDGMPVAVASGPRDDALREILHYAAVYGQNGPVEVLEVIRRAMPVTK